jgi:transcription-repair coupling factor (superfamily II helicase)
VLQGWLKSPAIESLRQKVGAGGVVSLEGVASAAQAWLVAVLHRLYPDRHVVAITDTLKSQEQLHADAATWLDGERPQFFPAWETLPQDSRLPHADIISERLETLIALRRVYGAPPKGRLVVTSVTALQQRTFTPADLNSRTRTLGRGQTVNPLDLIEWLESQGYEPEAQVSHKGELSWRGGIVDLWPLNRPWPVRLEFFGDELESLREFDPHRQTRRDAIDSCVVPPAGELSLLRPKAGSEAPPPPVAALDAHWGPEALVVVCGPEALALQAEHHASQVREGDTFHEPWEALQLRVQASGGAWIRVEDSVSEPGGDPAELRFESLDAFRPIGATLPAAQVAEEQRRTFFQQMQRWLRQGYHLQVFCNNAGELQRFGELWRELLPSSGTEGAEGSSSSSVPEVLSGTLSRGFLCEMARRVVVSDAEIYGRYKVSRPRRLKSHHAQSVRNAFEVDFTDFDLGDFVVHLQHGIGIYRGLKTLPPRQSGASGGGQECLVIEYAASSSHDEAPKLYVPVTEAHLVSKYVGAGKARPQLSTIGGTRWTKAKEQAQRSVRDLAAELLSVQAARATQPGHPFSVDTPWQREFEASFEFEETPDQVKAIAASKVDMELPKPMDRLICGDVGFGKTEVAIRAAFKAVMGGKQVALLVPTTVLAQQHYNHFRERMAEYPVRIELMSRFRTAKQQRAVMEAAAVGAVDIVIGTHRIVSADMVFKDLGLVVVDEEQKFGVKHKEQFKLLRRTVDVLTLSATPIPRTLYLALTGARDLSTLETPPQDRLPVETVVGNYDERVIRDAIQRELNRGGQVYFLHNRVSTIEDVALKLKTLVPDARILVGHGQMGDDDLEKVMTRFVNGEADVLVSTTIIESGLDIPNANTMIIDRADRFGLSELYQLRGRVGRYKHQAYCYLLLPRHAQLLTEARKRMSAIKQYSALGSGFKIAMRDLEIRGAGNLLGQQQSGHITAVGFDLYCQLLGQSISVLKGETVRTRVEVRVSLDFLATNPGEEGAAKTESRRSKSDGAPSLNISIPRDGCVATYWDDPDEEPSRGRSSSASRRAVDEDDGRKFPAYLPLDYVREPAQRVEVYRKLAQVADKAGVEGLRQELRDRFGPLPGPVDLLLQTHELRLLAAECRVTSVEVTEGKVKLMHRGSLVTVGGQFPRLSKRDPKGRIQEIRRLLLSLSGDSVKA